MAKHSPTAKAKKAYYGLIVKSYKRLRNVIKKHQPQIIAQEEYVPVKYR